MRALAGMAELARETRVSAARRGKREGK